jgi:hypothetical protein
MFPARMTTCISTNPTYRAASAAYYAHLDQRRFFIPDGSLDQAYVDELNRLGDAMNAATRAFFAPVYATA